MERGDDAISVASSSDLAGSFLLVVLDGGRGCCRRTFENLAHRVARAGSGSR